jgi:hypothetical protein
VATINRTTRPLSLTAMRGSHGLAVPQSLGGKPQPRRHRSAALRGSSMATAWRHVGSTLLYQSPTGELADAAVVSVDLCPPARWDGGGGPDGDGAPERRWEWRGGREGHGAARGDRWKLDRFRKNWGNSAALPGVKTVHILYSISGISATRSYKP